MTLKEKVIVSAYTGYLMCDFSEVHKYVEELLGRPVWTHELANERIQSELQEKARADFLKLCEGENDESRMGFKARKEEE